MIDTDETGEKKFQYVLKEIDSFGWTDYEREFLDGNRFKQYKDFSPKQKSMVGRLYDKLMS